MKRKIIVFIAIIIIPFIILLLDHYVLKEDVHMDAAYDQSADWSYIIQHQDDIPPSLLKLAMHNKETIPFVSHYLRQPQNLSLDLKTDLKSQEIPLLLQWDTRWGYRKYGDDFIAVNGCGPTCLSMILSYLQNNASLNPYVIAKYAYQKGYYTQAGTSWRLMDEGARCFGVNASQMPLNEDMIKQELDQHHPIICSVGPGIFTTEGHFIVLREYKNGLIYVNDPNSRQHSQKGYRFDEIKNQIKNLWVYSKEKNR